MARKRVLRNLPPLQETFQGVSGFSASGNKQLTLLEELRKVGKRLRKRQSIPFYSMREVAGYFSLPLRTVALVYETLELEGILNRIRGSKTMLVGKTISPRMPVRAVVGVPIWLHALVVSPYSRAVNVELEERLRKNGFVADLIFFRSEEIYESDFTQRLLHHNLDQVIWHTPHPSATNVLLSLKDNGVRQIVIQSNESPTSIAVPTYLQDWQPAYREMAGTWREAGISTVVVPDPIYLPSKRAMKIFAGTLAKEGLKIEIVESNAAALHRKMFSSRKKSACAVAVMDQQGADPICNEEPVIMEEIAKSFRVAFCRGPIRLPYFNRRSVKVDIIRFSAVEVATRVVQDLNNIHTTEGIIHVFKASYRPQVPLRDQIESL